MRYPGLAAAALVASTALGCTAEPGTEVTIGGETFDVEVAETAVEREQGLSGRSTVPPGTGMLFVYPDSAPRSYWMAGMLVPIDLAWIDDRVVLGVQTLQPCMAGTPCPTFTSPAAADAVLEVAAGALRGIEAGDRVVVEGG